MSLLASSEPGLTNRRRQWAVILRTRGTGPKSSWIHLGFHMDFSYHRSLGESTSAESTFRGFLIPGGWLTEIVTLSNIAYDTMPAEIAIGNLSQISYLETWSRHGAYAYR